MKNKYNFRQESHLKSVSILVSKGQRSFLFMIWLLTDDPTLFYCF